MKPTIQTREFVIGDYEAALELWNKATGIEVAEGDDHESIAAFLKHNPGLSRVATEQDRVVGVALCGNDGHRGHIYHLAVDQTYGGRGIGKRLVEECLDRLGKIGIQRAIILVAADNAGGRAFWERLGWEDVEGAIAMGKDVVAAAGRS